MFQTKTHATRCADVHVDAKASLTAATIAAAPTSSSSAPSSAPSSAVVSFARQTDALPVAQPSPFVLDDFKLLTTLGTGTFGRVRLVQLKRGQSFCALKILKKSEILRLQQLHHMQCEVDILRRLRHPFVVNYFGHFQDERRLYVVLEYVQGGELFSYLRRQGRFVDPVARYYAAQLVLAIAYLHAQHIIYRDLKPENVLITAQGYLKITDFGFAKIVHDKTWTLCGTPEYLAPEIIQSKGHGKSVDWWALGVLLYEMLAGYPPFYDENPFGIYQKILDGKLDFPKHVDAKAKDLIKKLLSQDRTKRLGTCLIVCVFAVCCFVHVFGCLGFVCCCCCCCFRSVVYGHMSDILLDTKDS